MTTEQLEKELLKNAKGLPKDALEEIIDFIQFVRQKKLKDPNGNISEELNSLSASQTEHLEQEFKDYKKLYPRE